MSEFFHKNKKKVSKCGNVFSKKVFKKMAFEEKGIFNRIFFLKYTSVNPVPNAQVCNFNNVWFMI
jgi:hypothetical protein